MRDLESVVASQALAGYRELDVLRADTLRRLALAAEYRDDNTREHTERVGALAARLAAGVGLGDVDVGLVRRAAPLHDLGKIAIPDSILLKPGKLTLEEYEVVKTHAVLGARVLEDGGSPLLETAAQIARSHHERWDGGGYPDSLAGDAIPIAGRIVHVADVFDVLVHERPYRDSFTWEQAAAGDPGRRRDAVRPRRRARVRRARPGGLGGRLSRGATRRGRARLATIRASPFPKGAATWRLRKRLFVSSWWRTRPPPPPRSSTPSASAPRAVRAPSRCSSRTPRTGCTGWSIPRTRTARRPRPRSSSRCRLLSDAAGRRVEGLIGDPEPLSAIQDAINLHGFDEIILSTLPTRVSRWLRLDLPHKVAGLGLPVTTVTAAGREAEAPASAVTPSRVSGRVPVLDLDAGRDHGVRADQRGDRDRQARLSSRLRRPRARQRRGAAGARRRRGWPPGPPR